MWTIIVIDIHIQGEAMKTVQMTLEPDLVAAVDRLARRLKTTRSAFARDALRAALARHQVEELERKHRAGYEKHPVKRGEFDVWQAEQQWGDS
jgi:predicted transcriptional regulator